MTDSMNFGPDWIRNLSSEGSTGGGGSSVGPRYQLADFRYGREEMLALFDKCLKPPPSLTAFKGLYSEQSLLPLALLPNTEEERVWQPRPSTLGGPSARGRGGSMDRGRSSRGRGGYQSYSRPSYESGWGNGEQADWSPRKDYNSRSIVTDNWRRNRAGDEEDSWRSSGPGRGLHDKWGRSTSWRGESDPEERGGPPERGGRHSWNDLNRAPPYRKPWENEDHRDDHLPEWANENPSEGGGSFDASGAFHGSDDEQESKSNRKEPVALQKSTSQQHITSKLSHPPLSSSKSAMSLLKHEENEKQEDACSDVKPKEELQQNGTSEIEKQEPDVPRKIDKEAAPVKENMDPPQKSNEKVQNVTISNGPLKEASAINKTEEDFDKFQEDLVLKLVVDEEPPKTQASSTFEVPNVQPPPNIPVQDKWYYQDPQGQMQGPFHNMEMAEWYKAGYFSHQLKVRRHCDERFVLLGELITLCGGDPFQSGIRFPPFKNETLPEQDSLQYQQLLSSLAMKQAQARVIQEPWSTLTTLQQQELAAQRLQMLHQQQISPDLTFMQQQTANTNPLMMMISKMQQANKLPSQSLIDKPPNTSMDPLLMMGNLQALQGRLAAGGLPAGSLPTGGLPTGGLPAGLIGSAGLASSGLASGGLTSAGLGASGLQGGSLGAGGLPSANMTSPGLPAHLQSNLPGSIPTNMTGSLGSETLAGTLQGLQSTSIGSSSLPLSSIQAGLPMGLPNSLNVPRTKPSEQLSSTVESDPISNLLRQLQQQQQTKPPLDSLWQQSQISVPSTASSTQQWQQQPPQPTETPHSMWDLQATSSTVSSNTSLPPSNLPEPTPPPAAASEKKSGMEKKQDEKEKKSKEESSAKELKKKKEDEKQAKKEAEEKRKQEQRKQEAEKRAAEEKKKKEEERIRKELEKHKKEAEEKRLRELEEKRRLKEHRKAEEEYKKKAEELKKQEEEKARREQKEREELARKQAEAAKQEQLSRSVKPAPWSQSNSTLGLSLTEIQKAEKERKAQEAALQLQRQQMLQEQQLQQSQEKSTGMSWAKKPIEPAKVKSLAEIQAEEQERLLKQAAEARLAALQKEKETPVTNPGSIWNGQNLSWASASSNNHWSGNTGGFWEDISQKTKPSVSKSSSTSAISNSMKVHPQLQPQQQQQQLQQSQQQKQLKNKAKKEEQLGKANNNNNSSGNNEFTTWCYKTLANITTDVDIPTFVSFLRDIESALDVREYCKEYLGDNPATQQFASNFLEKRRSFKPKNNAHKDDMCSPAPAITPSVHSNEFQEVKGKNKKNKKSKMYKVDSRILGFNVTSAPDRINVGDRDYGDNS